MEIKGQIINIMEFENFPLISGKLLLPNNKLSPTIEFVVDTGFTGDVLLNYNLFTIWSSKMQRVSQDAEVAESISGEIMELETVDSFIELYENYLIPLLISSHHSIKENLIGWGLLRSVITVLESNKITLLRSQL